VGVRLLLDTNSIIALLSANMQLIKLIENADELYISIVNELEFKSFSNISKQDLALFDEFASGINIIDLLATNEGLKSKIIEMRNQYRLKLQDAIIAASAIVNDIVLITADKGFKKVEELQLLIIE